MRWQIIQLTGENKELHVRKLLCLCYAYGMQRDRYHLFGDTAYWREFIPLVTADQSKPNQLETDDFLPLVTADQCKPNQLGLDVRIASRD